MFGGLLVLALVTALVAPYFIDWGRYRAGFEREASRILGQPVTVSGEAKARLLPFPSVTFETVRVGDAERPLVVADRFSMDMELAPFLSGEILIFDMRLVNPRIDLTLDERGLPDWSLPAAGPVRPARVVLENASIINGSITLHDAVDGRDWEMDSINASVSADSLVGPYRISGSGWLEGTPLGLRIATGALSREGFSLRTVVELERQGVELTVDGRMAEPGEGQDTPYTGVFTARPLDGLSDRRFTVQGAFAASPRSVEVAEYRGEFGDAEDPYVVSGSAALQGGDTPSYRVVVTGTQVNLPNEAADIRASVPRLTFAQRLARVRTTLTALPLPAMPGRIEVDLPAIVAGDVAIRDIRFAASPDTSEGADPRNQWKVSGFEAQLPGRTTVEADGVLHLPRTRDDGDDARFEGSLVVASRQPSGLATWLAGSADEAIRRLSNAGVAADVELSPERQLVENLEIILGPARLGGRLERIADPARRSTLDIELAGDGLDVDALEALSAVFIGKDGAARYVDHDLDVDLDLTNPDIRGVKLERLDASLRSYEHDTEINRLLITGLYGASVSATGSLTQGDKGLNATFDATVLAGVGAGLIEGLSARFPEVPALTRLRGIAAASPTAFDDARLDIYGTVRGDAALAGEASLSISGTVGGTELTVTGTARGDMSDAEKTAVNINASFDNGGAERLFAQAGLPVFPVDSPGPIRVETRAEGSLFDGMTSRFKATSGDTVLEVDGVLTSDILSTGFTGQAQLEANDIEPWLMTLGYALPGTGLGTTADVSAALSQRGGKTVLREIDAVMNGSRVTGDLTITASDALPTVRGELAFESLDAGPFYAMISGDAAAAIRVADAEDALDREFGPPILPDHDIEIDVTAGEVTFPSSEAALSDFSGTLAYRDNEMALRDGVANLGEAAIGASVSMRNEAGLMLLDAQLSMEKAPTAVLARPLDGLIAGTADVALHLTGTGRSNAALVDSMTGSGVMSTGELTVAGVRPDGFGDLIREADAIGYGITPEQIEAIAAKTLLTGETVLAPADYAISVTNGAVRLTNAHAQAGDLTIDLDADADLLTGLIEGDGRLSFDPGEEDVAGPQPEIALTFQSSENGDFETVRDFGPIVGFVTQRSLEREQARVEAMQARLLEKQRLRREVQLLNDRKRRREEPAPAPEPTVEDAAGQDAAGQEAPQNGAATQDKDALNLQGGPAALREAGNHAEITLDPRAVGNTVPAAAPLSAGGQAPVVLDQAARRGIAAEIFARRLATGGSTRGAGPKIIELEQAN
nr:AsmA family protein [Oricola sp.]